jgi:subtilisin-like proprotein convertase family protein
MRKTSLTLSIVLSILVVCATANASAPAAPEGCPATIANVANTTAVAIPAGPAVVVSTIEVAGVDPYLWDLDVNVALAHTYSPDLDVTLRSPAGTVVTITTDNGGDNNDDVFSATRFDDDADPDGQVPYTNNDGMCTEHAYMNAVAVAALTPEEPLGAFIGEDPNGTWTLTISDDEAMGAGTLNSWSLDVTAIAGAPEMAAASVFSNMTPVEIPLTVDVVSSTIEVSGLATPICHLDVVTNIEHTYANDLEVTLQSPMGTIVTLTTDNGGPNAGVFNGTRWSDKANPAGQVPYTSNNGLVTDHAFTNMTLAAELVPEEALSAFIGEDGNGTWTLTVSDDVSDDGGNFTWAIELIPCAHADVDVDGIGDACDDSVIVPNDDMPKKGGGCSVPIGGGSLGLLLLAFVSLRGARARRR